MSILLSSLLQTLASFSYCITSFSKSFGQQYLTGCLFNIFSIFYFLIHPCSTFNWSSLLIFLACSGLSMSCYSHYQFAFSNKDYLWMYQPSKIYHAWNCLLLLSLILCELNHKSSFMWYNPDKLLFNLWITVRLVFCCRSHCWLAVS